MTPLFILQQYRSALQANLLVPAVPVHVEFSCVVTVA